MPVGKTSSLGHDNALVYLFRQNANRRVYVSALFFIVYLDILQQLGLYSLHCTNFVQVNFNIFFVFPAYLNSFAQLVFLIFIISSLSFIFFFVQYCDQYLHHRTISSQCYIYLLVPLISFVQFLFTPLKCFTLNFIQ